MERRSFLIGASSVPAAGALSLATVASAAESENSPFVWRFRSLGYERAAVINPTDEFGAEYTYLMADGSLARGQRRAKGFWMNAADRDNNFDRDGWHEADIDEFNARVRGYIIACFVEDDGHWTRCLW